MLLQVGVFWRVDHHHLALALWWWPRLRHFGLLHGWLHGLVLGSCKGKTRREFPNCPPKWAIFVVTLSGNVCWQSIKTFFNLNCYVWVLPFLSVPSLDLKHLLMSGHLQGQNLARMSWARAHATPRKKMLASMSRVKEQVMVGAHPVRVLPICHYLNQKQPLMRKNHLQGPTIKGAPWAKAHPDPKIDDMLIPNHQWLFGTFFLLGMELLGQKPPSPQDKWHVSSKECLSLPRPKPMVVWDFSFWLSPFHNLTHHDLHLMRKGHLL